MAGVKISNLPAVGTPAYTDIFPIVQSGVTYKVSGTQFQSLFLPTIGGTLTGILNMGGNTIEALDNPVNLMDAVNKQYLEGVAVLKAGSTMTGYLVLVGDPTTNNEAANKHYVDLVAGGLAPSGPVEAATTGNFSATYFNGAGNDGIGATLTATATGTVTFDGVLTVANDTYLIKNQSNAYENGIYYCTTAGAIGVAAVFTRDVHYDTPADISNTGVIPVINGTTQANTGWYQTNNVTTIGLDNLNYTMFGNAGTVTSVGSSTGLTGGPITSSGNLALDIPVLLEHGGTNNALLTASNGGVVWSDASKLNVLSGTATAGQMLRSGASATPSWSTATYPSTAGTAGNVLTSDGTNFVSSPPAATTGFESSLLLMGG